MKKQANAPKVEIGATPTQDVKHDALPPQAVKLVLPDAFKNHDLKMTPENIRFAVELGEKHPAVVESVVALQSSLHELENVAKVAGEKYFRTVKALRETKLNRREATLLLKGLGFSKVTASKLQKVAEVSPELWAKYEAKQLGFNATLLLGREELSTETEDAPEGTEKPVADPAGGSVREPKKPKEETPFAKKYRDAILALLTQMGEDNVRASKDGMPYFFQYETAKGVKYQLTMKVL